MAEPDPADLAALAGDMQKLANNGEFNPFSLFAEAMEFHSVFLAPFSPSLTRAIERFVATGDGPLLQAVESLRSQGLTDPDARIRAREMFTAARGMCVVVMSGGMTLETIPQLFYGHLSPDWRSHAISSCGETFTGKDGLRAALDDLDAKARGGTMWPGLVAGPQAGSNLLGYWLELASGVVASVDEGILPVSRERLADLAHWTAAAAASLLEQGKHADADDLGALARCRLLAGEAEEATRLLDTIIARTGEDAVDDEHLLELIQHAANACARHAKGSVGAEWLERSLPTIEARLGRSYDAVLVLFKLLAGIQASPEKLVAVAGMLQERDRKSFKNDLMREPLWVVHAEDPGEVLDTNAAAAVIGRSSTFIAKRLEQGTIPCHRRGEQVRIPARGLAAWKAVMETYKLID
ncbi:MAG: helix-turn-helix domain-containing protein [Planctomycetes bacterium]|nr:helix-turn-helix domain-containing protein [Planctomycetota bacterium]